jgi:predicted  nucleic acid-binding Zn-ribbon protein
MFRCGHCGSGYSSRAAASLSRCPRCLAREKLSVPLTFEVGWQERRDAAAESSPRRGAAEAREASGRTEG